MAGQPRPTLERLRTAIAAAAAGEESRFDVRLRVAEERYMTFDFLEPNAALTLGLALHELATNAAKHGAFTTPAGRVEICSEIHPGGDERQLALTWSEHGGPMVDGNPRGGFGTTMIERGIAHQLGGKAQLEFRPQGLQCRIELPLANGRLRAPIGAWRDEDEQGDAA